MGPMGSRVACICMCMCMYAGPMGPMGSRAAQLARELRARLKGGACRVGGPCRRVRPRVHGTVHPRVHGTVHPRVHMRVEHFLGVMQAGGGVLRRGVLSRLAGAMWLLSATIAAMVIAATVIAFGGAVRPRLTRCR